MNNPYYEDEYEDYEDYDPENYEEYCPCCGAHFSFCLCDCWLTEFEEVRPSIMDINEMLGAFDPMETQEDYYESGAYYDDLPELPNNFTPGGIDDLPF